MSFLTGIEIRKLINEKDILVESLDPRYPFNPDYQVTEDAIDLRLAPMALRYKSDIKIVDYLKDDLPSLFEMTEIPADTGYTLTPGQVLFTQTLEVITLPNTLIGLVLTRSLFARLGLMINCVAPKFATGISWAFPLQLINCNTIPIIVYPYSVLAQLIISKMFGEPIGYQGLLQHCYTPIPPIISERDRAAFNSITSDAAKRTFHILSKEIELQKKEIKNEVEKKRLGNQLEEQTSSASDRSSLPLTVIIVRSICGILSALGFAVIGNLIASANITYWQVFSMILLAILSLVLMAVSFFLSAPIITALSSALHHRDKG